MSLWIKICGLTTPQAVTAAVAAGVDAVGFVFAPSKRQVTALRAAELAAAVPRNVLRIAVMQHPAQTLVDEVCASFSPDVLQTDHEDLAGLSIPAGVRILPVLRAGHAFPTPLPKQFLFEGPISGTGETADWRRAAGLAKQGQLILAGGLNSANVADAIRAVHPYGVDVSSGVESEPGIKEPRKIAQFVSAARAAYEAAHTQVALP